MASDLNFVTYVVEQMSGAGNIQFKKMFGEYALYLQGKCFGLVCDNTVFISNTEKGKAFLKTYEEGCPYKGAKPRIVLENLENRELLTQLILLTCEELPLPKSKTKKL